MVRQTLLVLALGILGFGVRDLSQAFLEENAAPVAASDCSLAPGEMRFVRLVPDPKQDGALLYDRITGETKQRVALVPVAPALAGKPLAVRILPAPDPNVENPAFPLEPGPVAGLLRALPEGLTPTGARHPGPVYWLDTDAAPRDSIVSWIIALLGFLAAVALWWLDDLRAWIASERATATDAEVPTPPRDRGDEEKPFAILSPPWFKAFAFLIAGCALGAAVLAGRELRTPYLWNSRVLVALGLAASAGLAWLGLVRASSGVTLCYGGLAFDGDTLAPSPFVRWGEVHSITREGPTTGAAIHLVVRTSSGYLIRLELGSGAGAVRTASSIVSLIRPWLLPRLRARIKSGKGIDFEQLRMTDDSIGWETSKGFRMFEFVDLEEMRIENGMLSFRMIGSPLDDHRCLYQELPNGFLLPLLLVIFMHKVRSPCRASWELADAGTDPFLLPRMQLAGADAWLAPAAPVFPEELARQGQAMLNQARETFGKHEPARALAMAHQALDYFESADNTRHPGVSVAFLLAGHLQLELDQANDAWETYGRCVKLLERVPGARPEELGRALNGLAVTLWRCREGVLAQEAAARAVECYDAAPAAPLADRVLALNTLTGLLHWRGFSDEARPVMERLLAALEQCAREPGVEIPAAQLLALMQNLTAVLSERTDAGRRADLHARGVEICRALLGEDHALVATAQFACGESALAAGDAGAAARAFADALPRYEARRDAAGVLACLDRLGDVYWQSGHRPDALALWERCERMMARPAA